MQLIRQQCGFLPFDFGCYSCLVVSISGRLVRSYLFIFGVSYLPLTSWFQPSCMLFLYCVYYEH